MHSSIAAYANTRQRGRSSTAHGQRRGAASIVDVATRVMEINATPAGYDDITN